MVARIISEPWKNRMGRLMMVWQFSRFDGYILPRFLKKQSFANPFEKIGIIAELSLDSGKRAITLMNVDECRCIPTST